MHWAFSDVWIRHNFNIFPILEPLINSQSNRPSFSTTDLSLKVCSDKDILIEIEIFSFQEDAVENVVCKMAAILFKTRCINMTLFLECMDRNQLRQPTLKLIQFNPLMSVSHISNLVSTWWRHQMEIFSALLAISAGNSPVTGEFPTQRPVTRSFDVFFHLRLNKRLSKQSWGWWFETLSRPLWRHYHDCTCRCFT